MSLAVVKHGADISSGDILEILQRVEFKLDQLNGVLAGQRKDQYTVEEVAAAVGRAEYTVRRWIKEKRLKATRIHGTGDRGRLLIPRSELEKLIHEGLGSSLTATQVATYGNGCLNSGD